MALPILSYAELNTVKKHLQSKTTVCQSFPKPEKLFSEITISPSGLVVHVVDAYDFPNSLIPNLPALIGGKEIVIAVNKIDLIEKNHHKQLLRFIRAYAGTKSYPAATKVCMVSAKQGTNIFDLVDAINCRSARDNVYFLGRTNAGKSMLLNALFKVANVAEKPDATVSNVPGTTAGFIRTKLSVFGSLFEPQHANLADSTKTVNWQDRYLVDTPGLEPLNSFTCYLSSADIQRFAPKTVPAKYRGTRTMKVGSSFEIAGLVRIDRHSGADGLVAFNGSSQVPLLYSQSDKIRIHDPSTKVSAPVDLLDPKSQRRCQFQYETVQDITDPGFYDVIISGLGFATVEVGHKSKVSISTVQGRKVYVRKSFSSSISIREITDSLPWKRKGSVSDEEES